MSTLHYIRDSSRWSLTTACIGVASLTSVAPAQQLAVDLAGGQAGAQFGSSMSSGYDYDGDGVTDVVVGAPQDGPSNDGLVYVYSSKDYSLIETLSLSFSTASRFGASVALIGDLDGDGTSELVVGAPNYDYLPGAYGFVGIISAKNGVLFQTTDSTGSNLLGASVAAAGDVDKDGVPDFLVSAPLADFVALFSGKTFTLLHGFTGTKPGAWFGFSVAGNVDVDGDGTLDVIVGEPVYDYQSGSSTVHIGGHVTVYSGATYQPIWDAVGPNQNDGLGWAVCGLGDVNGDGRSEVLASGSGYFNGGSGFVNKFDGTGSKLLTIKTAGADSYGWSLCTVPDIDGDGNSEYAIGAPQTTGSGFVDLRKGDDDAELWLFTPPDGSFADYGTAVAAGDVDGDGRGDLVIGDPARQVGSLTDAGGVDVWRTVEATTTSYGTGFPGTNGIPNLSAVNLPGIAETFAANLDNSLGASTVGLLVLGFTRESVVTRAGGTLLVTPFELLPVPIPATGTQLSGAIPPDPALLGVVVDLQVLELDAGAAHKISFTPGLELTIGVDYP